MFVCDKKGKLMFLNKMKLTINCCTCSSFGIVYGVCGLRPYIAVYTRETAK